jgi:protein-disulfide isomerase
VPTASTTERLLNVALGILTLCVIVITAAVVRREFFPPAAVAAAGRPVLPSHVADWRRYAEVGTVLGPASARLTVTEFSDFQCPACRQFAGELRSLRERYPGQIRVVYRHFPLTGLHLHAFAAALAAECAADQGRFEAFHDRVFRAQDSLGMGLSLSRIAADAQVADTAAFGRCLRDSVHVARVRADMDAGNRLGIQGTPTILFNDILVTGSPSEARLDSLTKTALAGMLW